MRTRRLVLFAAFLFAALPAHGGQQRGPVPSLRSSASVDGEFVRIGDLIEDAGEAARKPIFRAPELGQTGTIQVYRIIEAARQNGVSVFDTHGISEVLVTRTARTIPVASIERAVAETAAKQIGIADPGDVSVVLDAGVRSISVETAASQTPQIVQFNYDPRSRRFDASVNVPGSAMIHRKAVRVAGYLYESMEIPTIVRAFTHGETIRDSDIQMVRYAKADLPSDVIRNKDALANRAARRDLRAGQPVRLPEVMKPQLIARGDTVTISFEGPGVNLSLRAKAMEAGAEGDIIQVVNPQSKRAVQATIDAPGHVVVRSMKVTRAASAETTGSVK